MKNIFIYHPFTLKNKLKFLEIETKYKIHEIYHLIHNIKALKFLLTF